MATGRDLHIDAPLSNMAFRKFSSMTGRFIAGQVFPPIPVGKQSDKYYIIEQDAFLRVPDTRRAPKTKANRVEFDVSSESYYADNYALAGDNALEDLSNADSALMLRENTTNVVIDGLLIDQEVRVANTVTSISNVGSGVILTGNKKWGDFVSSSPLSDVTTGHAFIALSGMEANVAITDKDTLAIVRRHPELLDMYKYTSGGELTDAQLMEVFKVSKFLIGRGVKQNAKEGGTSSITNIWGNNFVLAYIDPNPKGKQVVTLGGAFRWQPAGFPAPFAVERQREDGAGSKKIEVIEANYFQDEKIIASALGYAITSTL